MELACDRLTVLVFEGEPQTSRLNHETALEVVRFGGRSFWLASQPDSDLPTICLPTVDEIVRPLVEIMPLQLLTIVMAQRTGFEPGKFRHIGKITLQE
jgi:glutamine---fructose-6-phosphate transaminase (isomerizing)